MGMGDRSSGSHRSMIYSEPGYLRPPSPFTAIDIFHSMEQIYRYRYGTGSSRGQGKYDSSMSSANCGRESESEFPAALFCHSRSARDHESLRLRASNGTCGSGGHTVQYWVQTSTCASTCTGRTYAVHCESLTGTGISTS